jgi:hypothetical protein
MELSWLVTKVDIVPLWINFCCGIVQALSIKTTHREYRNCHEYLMIATRASLRLAAFIFVILYQ